MRKELARRRARGDRGAVLVIVAVFMIVAVIMTAAVVDLGGLRQEEKEVTLSTDAAALAGAALADLEDPDLIAAGSNQVDCGLVETDPLAPNADNFATVQAAVDDYLHRNGGSAGVDCEVVRVGVRRGYVLVSADEIVDFAFGPAIGASSGSVAGVSVAAIQEQPGGGGLRPVGICLDASTLGGTAMDVRDLIDEAAIPGNEGVLNGGDGRDLIFAIDKVNDEDACGIAAGNFGQLDLNGGSNPSTCNNPDGFCWQMANGYAGPVTNPVNGDPGNNFVPSSGAIDGLIASGIRFYVPVYDAAVESGANAEFNITHYLEAEFVDYCLQKNQCGIDNADGDPMRWFRWRVYRVADFFELGPPSPTPPRICAVRDEAGVIAVNCQGSALPGGVTPPPPPPPPPPPSASCEVTELRIRRFADPSSAGSSSLALPWDNGNRLSTRVALDFTVADAADCSELSLRLGDNDLGSVSPPTETFVVAVEAGETQYQKSTTYTVTANRGGSAVTVPGTSLAIGN